MFTNVLVGVDGRQGGRDAIALAKQLATPDAHMVFGHVSPLLWGRGAGLAIPLERREARQMIEHGVSHLVVIDPATAHPSGIISSLDVAAAYAG